jgi:hypothetical protein
MHNTTENIYISSEAIQARVKEELRSFFYAGALDDLLFNTWVADCIDKFEYTYLPIKEAVLDMCTYKCELPCDFKAVREVWMCATYFKGPITSPHVFYYQTDCRIDPAPFPAESCSDCLTGYQCFPPTQTPTEVALPSLCDVPAEFICTHKVMNQMNFSFQVTAMLKPGNFRTLSRCHDNCPNKDVWNIDTFDIVGDNLVTSFREGTIYLAYYASKAMQDESGYYLIPDNDPFQKYVYYYLRYMVFQQLFDQSTSDDQFQVLRLKKQDSETKKDEAYIRAKTYAMSDDIYGLQRRIIRSYNRNNRFKLR